MRIAAIILSLCVTSYLKVKMADKIVETLEKMEKKQNH